MAVKNAENSRAVRRSFGAIHSEKAALHRYAVAADYDTSRQAANTATYLTQHT
jgi:hypothetical protein